MSKEASHGNDEGSSQDLPRRLAEYQTNYKVLLDFVKNSISTCLQDHSSKCASYPRDSTRYLPTRLIDLDVFERPRLVITAEARIQDRRYVPLSHQWGLQDGEKRMAMMTTDENLESRISGIDLETLPGRYQEAIIICKLLDIRYIWIDSLCIIQGSKEDWHRECREMTKVYECGVFTIAANILDGEEPWLVPDHVKWAVRLWPGGPNATWLSELLLNGPLAHRGWCLQERHLSPRIIHVFHDNVWVWECDSRVRGFNKNGTVYRSEVTDDFLKWRKLVSKGTPETSQDGRNRLLDRWDMIIEDYSKRKLTCQSDLVPALYGLVSKVQPLLSLQYLGGFWESDLLGLMWFKEELLLTSELKRRSEDKSSMEVVISNAPSWSWYSARGRIRYVGFLDHKEHYPPPSRASCELAAKMMGNSVYYNNDGGLGENPSITIRSRFLSRITNAHSGKLSRAVPFRVSLDLVAEGNIAINELHSSSFNNDAKAHNADKIQYLILGWDSFKSFFGLILSPVNNNHTVFCRVGIFVGAAPESLRRGSETNVKII